MSETPDQAATRRRWVTLAELVAVAGVIIAALTLWNNWSDRRADEASRAAERAAGVQAASTLALSASVRDGGRSLLLRDGRHDLQDVTITFPAALGAPVQHPLADPVITAKGIEAPLLALTDHGADERTGRLPALIATTFLNGDASRTTTGLYDVIWRTKGRFPFGRTLRLEALRLRARHGTPVALDAAWAREKP